MPSALSAPQEKALRALAEATVPLRLNRATAGALERRGYAEPFGDRWMLARGGRKELARRRGERRREELRRALTADDCDQGRRVACLLEALGVFSDWRVLRYAEHLAACSHANRQPAPPPMSLAAGVEERVRNRVDGAARILRDFDAARGEAKRRGKRHGDFAVVAAFYVEKRTPERQATPDAEVERDAGAVDLAAFRARRFAPAPTGGQAP